MRQRIKQFLLLWEEIWYLRLQTWCLKWKIIHKKTVLAYYKTRIWMLKRGLL